MSKSKGTILQKSKQLFQQYGFQKTTLTDIAKSVGKVKTAIYYYFSRSILSSSEIKVSVRCMPDIFWILSCNTWRK